MGTFRKWLIRAQCSRAVHTQVLASVILICIPIAAISQAPSPDEQKALDAFAHKAKQYVAMEHGLPADKMKPTTDVKQLEQQREALRQAVLQARPDAKQGDFFTPEAATAFRRLLARTMSGPDGAMIRASLAHAEPGAPPILKVNGVFPDTGGQPAQSVPPTLLLNLPRLPKGLQYAIAGKTLALRDDATNLVIDLLPNALP